MPRSKRKPQSSWEGKVGAALDQTWDDYVAALAQELGDAPDTKRLNDKELLDQYWFTDARYPDASQLLLQGRSPEEATGMKYPYRFRLFADLPPKEQVKFVQRMNRLTEKAAADGWTPPVGVPDTAAADVISGQAQGPATPPAAPPVTIDQMPGAPMGPPLPGQPAQPPAQGQMRPTAPPTGSFQQLVGG